MENSAPLINELTQGRDLAKQLRIHLGPTASNETRELLTEKILSSFENAISMLKWSGSEPIGLHTGMSESPHSFSGSPGSEDSDQDQIDISKKRKTLPRWTEQVRISSTTGLEGPLDDGYCWRKYGQKDILGAKFPRAYYRCTHRKVQGCLATKQVQRSDEDPSIFEVIYRGRHTCIPASHLTPAMTQKPASSSKKQEAKRNQDHSQQQEESKEILLNFRTGVTVETEGLDNQELITSSSSFSFPSTFSPSMPHNSNNFMDSYSPPFISPATSESIYFSASPCPVNSFGRAHDFQTSESDFTEIISAVTSVTDSPIVNIDFKFDPAEFDPNFLFDNPGFFP